MTRGAAAAEAHAHRSCLLEREDRLGRPASGRADLRRVGHRLGDEHGAKSGEGAIYLDGRFLGSAAELGGLRRGLLVDPGEHELSVVRPGFDPRASISLWTNMENENPLGPPEWLSTHPSGDTRIGELAEELAETLPYYNAARDAGLDPNCRR